MDRPACTLSTQGFIDYYQLQLNIDNNWLYVQVDETMYGLPQLGQVAHDEFKGHLKPHGYKSTIISVL